MNKADVVVIGGGPAGTAAAMHLTQLGHHVVLYEGARYPRDKPCGEFVNGAGLQHLVRLGVHLPNAVKVSRATLATAKGSVTVDLDEPGISVRRTHLDQQMARRAIELGVELHEGHRVRGIEGHEVLGEGFRCEAGVIVAADGSHSSIARQLGLVVPVPRLQRVGFVAHVRPHRSLPLREVRMFAGFGGSRAVGGFSMQNDDTGVISCVLAKPWAKRLAGMQEEFAKQLMREWLDVDGDVLDARATDCFGHTLKRLVTKNILFVGDAARFVDPFTGEGIHHALVGANLAAEVASQALHKGKVSRYSLKEYEIQRRELDARYRLSDLVQSVVHRDGLVSRVARRLQKRPAVAKRLFETLTDAVPPGTAMNPKTLWEVFGL